MSGTLRDRVEAEATRVLRDRLNRLRQSLEDALSPLGAPVDLPLAPGEWGAAGGLEQLRTLRDTLEVLAQCGTQRDVLGALLDAAATCYRRAALFVLKDATLTGWSGLGFTGDGSFRNEDLRRVTLPATGEHLLAQALQRKALAMAGQDGPGDVIVSNLGQVHPRDSVAMPLLVRGRAVAVLYGDTGTEAEGGQTLGFEIMARVASLVLASLLAAPSRRARPQASAPALPMPGREPSGPAEAAPGAPTPPEEAEIQALQGDLDGHPRRESGDSGMSDEERRSHADARRFASLLVSELLLYNEESIIQGRKHHDIRQRLATEIDRSRQAYEARVPSRVRSASNYLEDEMVRVLAEGDRALFGN